MITPYYDTIQMVERLHRQYLDVLKMELERRNVHDINNVQTMILFNIGDDEMTVGELTLRGYYLGSNVSYNVKKMVENDYLVQERSVHDRRSVRVRLSDKGIELRDMVAEMFKRHEAQLADYDLDDDRLKEISSLLRKVERFWTSQAHQAGIG